MQNQTMLEVTRMTEGQARLWELYREVSALCTTPLELNCARCTVKKDCDARLMDLLVELLNSARNQVDHERVLIAKCRQNPRYSKAMQDHQASHEQLMNDLSSYIMDCALSPSADLVQSVVASLRYWIEGHFLIHDDVLLEFLAGSDGSK